MSDGMSENKIKYITGGLMFVVAIAIVYFAFWNKPKEPVTPFKTLEYAEAVEKLNQADGKQMFYIGCRDCGHCMNLEQVIKSFLAKYEDKNADQDLIYKVEAGYTCVPQPTDASYSAYSELFDFLVKNNIAPGEVEDGSGGTVPNTSKQFGTPQFFYVENGKVVDELDNYGRTTDGLTEFFKAHSYRGF